MKDEQEVSSKERNMLRLRTCAELSRLREGLCRSYQERALHIPRARGKAVMVVGSRVPVVEARNTGRGPGSAFGDVELEVPLEHQNGNIM